MTILTILPTDTFVSAAFAELLEDVTNLLSAARDQKPADRGEIKFWQSQFNALNKAQSNYLSGVRPQIAQSAYLLASASRPGALVHRLTHHGGIVVCSCEAGQKQALCWHHMLINVLERAAELESLAAERVEEVAGGGAPPIAHGKEAAQWIGGQQQLQTRLAATAQYLVTLRTSQQRTELPTPRPLRVRLVEARKKSAYFASALYLAA